MGALRVAGAVVLIALAGCGGGDSPPQPPVPRALAGLDGAVMTETRFVRRADLDEERLQACGVTGTYPGAVERTTADGQSLTLESGTSIRGCDAIENPASDPHDDPYGGQWCGSATGHIESGTLADPRLDLCTAENGDITAFAWVVADKRARWLVVREGDRRDIYDVLGTVQLRLVRVTTTENIDPAGRASFDIEEYAADGTKLREYVLETAVAG